MTDESYELAEAALGEVRNECQKAALLYALVDATAVFLGVNLAISALGVGWLPDGVAVPAVLADPLAEATGLQTTVAVPGSALAAGAVALPVLVAELWWRLRQPLIEQFETVNPVVAETLRTARDAVDDGARSPMAARLYEDALEKLSESSGVALVDTKRLLGPVLVVVALAVVTPQAAVVDVTLVGGGEPTTNATDGEKNRTYTGLRDGDQVLGDATSVSDGEEELTAAVESSGAGREVEEEPQFPETGPEGASGVGGGVDTQQAEFAGQKRVEEAELVREYNRRIREEDSE